MYFVREGTLVQALHSPLDADDVLESVASAWYGAGSWFGEVGMLLDILHEDTVIADNVNGQAASCVSLAREAVEDLLPLNAKIADSLKKRRAEWFAERFVKHRAAATSAFVALIVDLRHTEGVAGAPIGIKLEKLHTLLHHLNIKLTLEETHRLLEQADVAQKGYLTEVECRHLLLLDDVPESFVQRENPANSTAPANSAAHARHAVQAAARGFAGLAALAIKKKAKQFGIISAANASSAPLEPGAGDESSTRDADAQTDVPAGAGHGGSTSAGADDVASLQLRIQQLERELVAANDMKLRVAELEAAVADKDKKLRRLSRKLASSSTGTSASGSSASKPRSDAEAGDGSRRNARQAPD
jgi:hypothetical protein